MNIKIDKNSLITITQQLVHYFSDRIMSEFIKAGQKLPSIRNLAKELGISPMTIIKAYNNLEQNGLVTTIQGKGTYVNERNSTVKSNNITEKIVFSGKCLCQTIYLGLNLDIILIYPTPMITIICPWPH